MEMLYLLVPVALITLVVVIKILFWAINSGQYDDLETEAQRILFDEDHPVEGHLEQDTTHIQSSTEMSQKDDFRSPSANKEP